MPEWLITGKSELPASANACPRERRILEMPACANALQPVSGAELPVITLNSPGFLIANRPGQTRGTRAVRIPPERGPMAIEIHRRTRSPVISIVRDDLNGNPSSWRALWPSAPSGTAATAIHHHMRSPGISAIWDGRNDNPTPVAFFGHHRSHGNYNGNPSLGCVLRSSALPWTAVKAIQPKPRSPVIIAAWDGRNAILPQTRSPVISTA